MSPLEKKILFETSLFPFAIQLELLCLCNRNFFFKAQVVKRKHIFFLLPTFLLFFQIEEGREGGGEGGRESG